jgi:hypothetical protein
MIRLIRGQGKELTSLGRASQHAGIVGESTTMGTPSPHLLIPWEDQIAREERLYLLLDLIESTSIGRPRHLIA